MIQIQVGEKFGRLTIIENHHPKDEVICKCDCGNIKTARATNVYYGGTKSCGCLFNEGNNLKHGHRRAKEKSEKLYGVWKTMRERCNNSSCKAYKNYGQRGIKVCDEWKDYETFRTWAYENGYKEGLSIDRLYVDGDYEPQNCRWADDKQQANNKRNNRILTFKGKSQTMTQWADETGIKVATIWARLNRGWSVEKTLSQ